MKGLVLSAMGGTGRLIVRFRPHTTDQPAWAGRAIQIAAMAITGLVAFGRLYLIHDPGEWRIANQLLGYPLYIIPLLGVTHILGGVGLLIPNVHRSDVLIAFILNAQGARS
jgi:hypothetical protein